MAKRKLSLAQRSAIRDSIRTSLQNGAPRSQIVKTLSQKYKIRPEAVRWHLQRVLRELALAQDAQVPRSNGNRRVGLGSASVSYPLDELALQDYSDKRALERARMVRRLMPRWQAELSMELSLRHRMLKLYKTLIAARARAQKLQKQITRLASPQNPGPPTLSKAQSSFKRSS